MRKLLILILFLLACVPRKTLKEELDVNKLQENLKKLYETLASSEVKGSYLYQSADLTLSGHFRMTKKGNEWIVILQNPLSPSIIKINEDTLPIKSMLNQNWSEAGLKYEILGTSLKLNYKDSLYVQVETINSLPYRISYNGATAVLSYTGGKLKEIKIQTEEDKLILQLNY
jgi:hypothetical protein